MVLRYINGGPSNELMENEFLMKTILDGKRPADPFLRLPSRPRMMSTKGIEVDSVDANEATCVKTEALRREVMSSAAAPGAEMLRWADWGSSAEGLA